MICANCGTENRPGRRFCGNCGNALAAVCVNCGAENDPVDRFCGNCGLSLGVTATTQAGSTIQPSQTPPTTAAAAQRRLVTVLFADLVGFTPFAEERDAEDVRDTLEGYGAIARDVVGRYGGTVEKFIGDAVMAVWGTPTAHEDDAERAVRAALELADAVRALGPEIQARAGVLTGEAAVNVGAIDQNLLAGDLVNTAARLQSVAAPGSVLVGESTMHATSASVAYEPAGDQALKGKQAPVPAWRALRVVAQRRGARRAETVETPFVGRDEEFRLLKDQLHLTGRDPRTRLVSITGPAGIGKSRLAWELEKYIDGIVDTIYWHRGRCPSYGEGVSFWALGEMVRRRAGLAETDDEETTRQLIRQTVEQYVAEPTEREWINQALLVLLGVELETTAGQPTLFAAWRRFFENVAALGTTVLVFEDLHWADPGLLDFIDHVLDWSKAAPLLVVTLARPELFDRRPDWGASRRTFTAMALDPLPEPAMREMLRALVPDLPAAALSAIVARADGIPLYAVETVRMLLADGRLVEAADGYRTSGELGNLEVPDSLRSLITSRLDGLDTDDRRMIQDASVLGQTFTVESLADLTGEPPAALEARLRQLVRRELLELEQDPRSPERGQFGFTQSLVREVAYSTLTRPQRRERHLAAARYLEASGGDELAGALAGHYVAAYDASAAGPEADAVATQARLALRGAADRAAALGGHKQAADFLKQALAVAPSPADRAQLLERRAEESSISGNHEQAESDARAAVAVYRELGDQAGVGRVRARLGQILVLGGKEPAAVVELEEALAETTADTDPETKAEILAKLARALYRNNRNDDAVATADLALQIAEKHRLLRIVADAMVSKASALGLAARPIEGITLLRGGIELARRVGDVATELRGSANLSLALSSEEGSVEAQKVTVAALETARRVGDLPQVAWHTGNSTFARSFMGDSLAETLAAIDELEAMGLSTADHANLLRGRAWVTGLMGLDVEPIMAEYSSLMSAANQTGLDFYRFFYSVGRGDFERAMTQAERATDERPDLAVLSWAVLAAAANRDAVNAGRLRAKLEESPILSRAEVEYRVVARAALAALDGKFAEHLPELRAAMREIDELGDVINYGLAALVLLRLTGPDVAEVREFGQKALANFERMGAAALAEQLRTALSSSTTKESPRPAVTETASATVS